MNSTALQDSIGTHLHRFHGGLRLRHNKKISCRHAVERPPLPELLTVPLQQHLGAIARAKVAAGDHVLKGQSIGTCDTAHRNEVHAPTSGVVVSVELMGMSHPSGLPGTCVTIRPDGEDRWCDLSPVENWRETGTGPLIQAIRAAGIVGLGGAVFPTPVSYTHLRAHETYEGISYDVI